MTSEKVYVDKKLFLAFVILGILATPLIYKAFALSGTVGGTETYGDLDVKTIGVFFIELTSFLPGSDVITDVNVTYTLLFLVWTAIISVAIIIFIVIKIRKFIKKRRQNAKNN